MGVMSIPACAAAAALALTAGPMPDGLGPAFEFTGLNKDSGRAHLPDFARRALSMSVVCYTVAMVGRHTLTLC